MELRAARFPSNRVISVSLDDAIQPSEIEIGAGGRVARSIVVMRRAATDSGFIAHSSHWGITNYVIDSASIEVDRRKRRAKTDRVDLKALLRLLLRYLGGETEVMRVIRIPSPEAEDRRRLHRERERLLKERGSHSSRIQALLVTQGIKTQGQE